MSVYEHQCFSLVRVSHTYSDIFGRGEGRFIWVQKEDDNDRMSLMTKTRTYTGLVLLVSSTSSIQH